MAATSGPQVPPRSLDSAGLSVATASRDADPRRGSVYTDGLQGADPVWFHPLNTGHYLMVMAARRVGNAVLNGPSWMIVDPATGTPSGAESVPSRLAVEPRTLVDAASRGDYLFLLSSSAGKALVQHFRVTNSGGMALLGEEWVPADLACGLCLGGNYLWVFGRHESGTLAVSRRNWGRIGSSVNADPQMNWQHRTAQGWSADVADLAPLPGDLPADGPCSVASLADRFYLVATARVGSSWAAQGYTSRLVDSGWTRTSFTVDLGDDDSRVGSVRLQPQLALTPGYTATATTGGATVLTDDDTRVQVLTGTSGHILTLPASLSGLEPFVVYNQSTADITVAASGGGTVAVVERGTAATFTPAVTDPTAASGWTRAEAPDRTPRARSGFPYVLTFSPDTVNWETTWAVFEV